MYPLFMFCPLCKAEYREGIERCAACACDLVESLDAPDVKANPPALLWSGKDNRVFALLHGALLDAHIPCRAKETPRSLFSAWMEDSRISVRSADFARAQNIVKQVFADPQRPLEAVKGCPMCSVELLAGAARCAACGTELIADISPMAEKTQGGGKTVLAKVCPLCGAGFGTEPSHCTQCGIELIPSVEAGLTIDLKDCDEPLETVWRGGEVVALSRVLAELRAAAIPHHVMATHDNLAFGLAMPRAFYVVRVFASEAAAANELLAPIIDSLPYALSRGPEPCAGEPEPPEELHSPSGWRPKHATSEVWSGEDAAFARILSDCLLENGVPSRIQRTNEAAVRVFVRPQEAPRAKEILQELLSKPSPS